MNHCLRFEIHESGAFDIVGARCSLHNAWPAIDAAPIRPIRVELEGDSERSVIRYKLDRERCASISLRTQPGCLRLQMQLEGFEQAPHWTSPIFDAEIAGASGLFRTGIGFSGPTSYVDISDQTAEYAFDSYLATGLCTKSGETLAFGAFEHGDFLAKAHISNRYYRHNFRNREVERNLARLEILFATERITPRGTLVLPEIVFTAGTDAWNTLRRWAEHLARERQIRPNLSPSYHFCSWYDRGPNFSQADLDRLLVGLQARPEPLTFVQIDAGYCPSLGDWLVPRQEVWPQGLEHAFRCIHNAGYTPGIWVAPFMIGSRSTIAREHPEWILHDLNNRPIPKWKRYDGGGIPGHTDEETYILDTSHPDALTYVEHVFRTLRQSGARMFKTDFLEWGYIDSTKVRRARPGRTSAQYYREAMQRIRTAIGDSYWLGCIAYFAPMIGFCDGMRVSSDVGVKWEGVSGTGNDGVGGGIPNAIEETHGCHVFHNIFWQNDPDVTFFRERHIELVQSEIESLAYWNCILGVSMNTSDCVPELPEHRWRLWRFVRPQQEPWAGRIASWPKRDSRHIAIRFYPTQQAYALLVFNAGTEAVRDWIRLADFFEFASSPMFTWGWDGARPLGEQSQVTFDLPAHHSSLYYISPSGEPPPADLTLGGYRTESSRRGPV